MAFSKNADLSLHQLILEISQLSRQHTRKAVVIEAALSILSSSIVPFFLAITSSIKVEGIFFQVFVETHSNTNLLVVQQIIPMCTRCLRPCSDRDLCTGHLHTCIELPDFMVALERCGARCTQRIHTSKPQQ